MLSSTLTSLAMLKVHVDQRKDYLDYLLPFIQQVLVDQKPDPVTDAVVAEHLRTQFGLIIPDRTVQVVLKRVSRKHPLKKEAGVYRITGKLPDPGIAAKKADADRHIKAVVAGLMEFSKRTAKPITVSDDAVTATLAFLSQFNIPCLRAYLRGTAIPPLEGDHDVQIVLVSKYVLHLQETDPERFESFLVVVQGHMLANALLCPDLQYAPKTYRGVAFYLDTPLLVQRLGLEGNHKKAAVENLIGLLHKLGAAVATFSHSRDELERVVKGAANHVEAFAGGGAIVMEARRHGTTKSDLILLTAQLDEKLTEAKIEVIDTPRHIADFQIDESAFEQVLDDEVSYFNPRAKEYDINSVRSIYVLRARTSPSSVEKSKAVFVSSNAGFARAAFQYGQIHDASREVSSVITDFSLANMAWLKAPMGAPSLPMTEILAFSYAALQPSKELLGKFLEEIDKLEKQGRITERDHQLLRSSTLAQEELMHLTLGDEEILTDQTITETLNRVTSEIKKEESDRLKAEQVAHLKTQADLNSEREAKERMRERLYWRCRRRAKVCAWLVSAFIAILVLTGLSAGLGLQSSTQILGWLFTIGSGVLILLTLGNLIFGATVRSLHQRVEDQCCTWLIKRAVVATGLDLRNHQ